VFSTKTPPRCWGFNELDFFILSEAHTIAHEEFFYKFFEGTSSMFLEV